MRAMRLSTRVAIGTTAVVSVLLVFAGVLLLGLVNRALHDDQDAQLRDRAAAVLPYARNVVRASDAGRARAEANQQRRLAASALDVGVRLVRADGTVLVAVGPQPGPDLTVPSAIGRPLTVRADGRGWRVLGTPVTATDGTLWLFSPASTVNNQLGLFRARMLIAALIAAPIAGLLSLLVTERVVLPLRRLQRRTSGLDPRTSDTRLELEPTRVAEVDDLAGTLRTVLTRYDEQAARTAEALATARAFAASASHELRTPLMSMRTNLDILAEHPELPAGERGEVVEDLRAEHARLLDLLVALRALAQGDLVEADAFAPVDLVELAEAAVREARRLDPSAEIALRAPEASVQLSGWGPGLRMALDNLLTNALVHGHAPGEAARVLLSLRVDGPSAVVTVDDAGPGIPEADRSAVFQRFHRAPGSPGSGLGLTLVAQQVALHGGEVRLGAPDDGVGTRVALRLPLTQGSEPPRPRDWLTSGG